MKCKQCGMCCEHHPCSPNPDEVAAIAEHLGITIEELIKMHTVLDYWVGDEGDEYYVVFARVGDTTGEVAPWSWTFGCRPCVFLTKDKRCMIHPVKPKQAQVTFCRDCFDDDENPKDTPEAPGKRESVDAWAPFMDDDRVKVEELR